MANDLNKTVEKNLGVPFVFRVYRVALLNDVVDGADTSVCRASQLLVLQGVQFIGRRIGLSNFFQPSRDFFPDYGQTGAFPRQTSTAVFRLLFLP